jgi:polynucleotide 5'-triphosphatase
MSEDGHSQSDDKESPPLKRARHNDQSWDAAKVKQSSVLSTMNTNLPPLSLSILGVEPLDEFIREVADFVHHMIVTRPVHPDAKVEVEAKLGILRDRTSGQRLMLPVLVETSMFTELFVFLA